MKDKTEKKIKKKLKKKIKKELKKEFKLKLKRLLKEQLLKQTNGNIEKDSEIKVPRLNKKFCSRKICQQTQKCNKLGC